LSDEIVWEDPPLKARGNKQVWIDRLTPLLEYPNRWAKVFLAGSAVTATKLRRREYVIPEGRWEFRTHQIAMGQYEVYARYLGPKEGES
jgi:hypothetical protein